jgi:hypothetical protein
MTCQKARSIKLINKYYEQLKTKQNVIEDSLFGGYRAYVLVYK